jgi:hypothetical protein
MVTFPPVGVDRAKPDVDTLLTLPIDPPAAGPERALDPPPDPEALALVAYAAVVEEAITADELPPLVRERGERAVRPQALKGSRVAPTSLAPRCARELR